MSVEKIIKYCKTLTDPDDKSVIRFNQMAGNNVMSPVVITNAEFDHILIEVSTNHSETVVGVSVVTKYDNNYSSTLSFLSRDYSNFITHLNNLKRWTP